MSLRPTLLLLSLSTLFASTPARAGRASACKAPPFAVPKETQRAVDAAIDARVVGTGAGAVSTSVETRTDYETTTLSQDAVATAWFEYTLCAKLAKKLISQELHDDLLRGILSIPEAAAPVAPTTTAGSGSVEGAAANDVVSDDLSPEQLVGTWQVSATFRDGSCPQQLKGGSFAYTWLISSVADGGVAVSVQGKTSYAELRGTVTQGVLQVGGEANAGGASDPSVIVAPPGGPQLAVLPRTDFRLQRAGDSLVGTRELVTWTSTLTDDDTTYTVLPCVLHYDVRATR